MHTFVWKVKDRSGKDVIREVLAETGEESRRILLADGCTDLILKEDEIVDVTTAGMKRAQFLGKEISVTAEQRLKHRDKKQSTFVSVLTQGMWQSKWLLAIIITIGAYGLYRENRTS